MLLAAQGKLPAQRVQERRRVVPAVARTHDERLGAAAGYREYRHAEPELRAALDAVEKAPDAPVEHALTEDEIGAVAEKQSPPEAGILERILRRGDGKRVGRDAHGLSAALAGTVLGGGGNARSALRRKVKAERAHDRELGDVAVI